jgi:imidazolonepropionase-like amidohydrolase
MFAGKLVAIVDVEEERGVELAVRIFRQEYQLPMVLSGGEAASKQTELLSKEGVPVLLGPNLVREVRGERIHLPLLLATRSVPMAFQSKATTGAKQLPDAIAFSVHQGLGRSDALVGLTSGPAQQFQLDSIGSLAVGKDADLVVLSGEPLDLGTEVLAVVIDGKLVYEKDAVKR